MGEVSQPVIPAQVGGSKQPTILGRESVDLSGSLYETAKTVGVPVHDLFPHCFG